MQGKYIHRPIRYSTAQQKQYTHNFATLNAVKYGDYWLTELIKG
jgi:hypothetical protein